MAAVLLTGCSKDQAAGKKKGSDANAATPVQVTAVKTGTIAQTVPITGSLAALEDVTLAAKATAPVSFVAVREGDFVHKGQLVIQQDITDLAANVRQDQAAIQADQAQVSQAQTNLEIQITQAKQAILQARATLNGAQQNYSKVKGGNRPQQIDEAQAQFLQAKANEENALIDLNRDNKLLQAGAIAQADRDTAQNTYNVDVQIRKNAEAALSLSKAGSQAEDIASALEQVKEQQTNLKTQIANEKQVEVRKGEIQAALATVAQGRAKLTFDQQQVDFASIRSPIDGIVASRLTEPGQIASPGTGLIRIVNVKTVYYEPTISESDFTGTTVGDSVSVHVDALPGRAYQGKVAAVYPAATSGSHEFSLRVTVANPKNEMRPGMFARGTLQTEVHRNVVIVPVAALLPLQSSYQANTSSVGDATGQTQLPPQQVFLVGPGNKAKAQPVKIGIVNDEQAEVTSGLKAGDQIITTGQASLQPDQNVKVVPASNSAETANASP